MDSRGVLALSLVVVLVTAGCAGVVGQSGTTSANEGLQPTETTTTTTTTTENTTTGTTTTTTTETAPDLPPGLAEDGVVNAWRLASAHAAALEGTSFTVTRSEADWYENGTFASQTAAVTRVGPNGSTVSVLTPQSAGETEVAEHSTWSNGSAAVARTEWLNGSVDHRAVKPGQARLFANPTDRDALYGLYNNINLSVVGQVQRNNTTLFRLVSSGADEGALANATVVILVDGDGLVHEYHVSRMETTVQGTFNVDRTVRFTAVGETSVERPEWFDEVENASAA